MNITTLGRQYPQSSNPASSTLLSLSNQPPSTDTTWSSFPQAGIRDTTAASSDNLKEPLLEQPEAVVVATEHARLSSSDPALAIQSKSAHSKNDKEEHSASSSLTAYQPLSEDCSEHTLVELHEHRRW